MVTKRKKGTAIAALCANVGTEEFVRVPLFVRKHIKSQKTADKIAREEAEKLGLNFIKADMDYVTMKYTMEDDEFYENAKEEIE